MSSLTFVYGCMNAAKTSILLMSHHACKETNKKPIILKPTIDIRDGRFHHLEFGKIKSRLIDSGTKALYLEPGRFYESEMLVEDKDIVFVDEAQFLTKEDVWFLSDVVDNLKKEVIVYGLKTNAEGELFEGSSALLAMADELEECRGICKCGRRATHHIRLSGGAGLIGEAGVESEDVKYESVCRRCFKEFLRR